MKRTKVIFVNCYEEYLEGTEALRKNGCHLNVLLSSIDVAIWENDTFTFHIVKNWERL